MVTNAIVSFRDPEVDLRKRSLISFILDSFDEVLGERKVEGGGWQFLG